MLTGSYSIEELSAESGFDKRAIRSLIEQGLLTGPDSKGRYARYTSSHLIRLRAIRILRDLRNMTLSEIRAAFLAMTEEDIHALSKRAAREQESKRDATPLNTSVLDYLRLARLEPDAEESSSPFQTETAPGAQRLSAVDRLMLVLKEDLGAKRLSSHSKGQLWHRFTVTPDIEISVRGLPDGGQVEQWERIADCLREILLGGAKHEFE